MYILKYAARKSVAYIIKIYKKQKPSDGINWCGGNDIFVQETHFGGMRAFQFK